MGVGSARPHRVQEMQGTGDVLHLRVDRVSDVDHGVGGRALLPEVDDGLGALLPEHVLHERVLGKVAAVKGDLAAHLAPDRRLTTSERRDRGRRPAPDLRDPPTRDEIVDADHFVAAAEQVEGERPAGIAIDARDEDLHRARPPPAGMSRAGPLCFVSGSPGDPARDPHRRIGRIIRPTRGPRYRPTGCHRSSEHQELRISRIVRSAHRFPERDRGERGVELRPDPSGERPRVLQVPRVPVPTEQDHFALVRIVRQYPPHRPGGLVEGESFVHTPPW